MTVLPLYDLDFSKKDIGNILEGTLNFSKDSTVDLNKRILNKLSLFIKQRKLVIIP